MDPTTSRFAGMPMPRTRPAIVQTASGSPPTVVAYAVVPVDGTSAQIAYTPGHSMTPGTTYYLRFSGTWVWGGCDPINCPGGEPDYLRWGDAAYLSNNHFDDSRPDQFSAIGVTVDGNFLTNMGVSAFDPTHVYQVPYVATSVAPAIRVQDCGTAPGDCYSDNTGDLRLEILNAPASSATDFALGVLALQQRSMEPAPNQYANWGADPTGQQPCYNGSDLEECGCMLTDWAMLFNYWGHLWQTYTDPRVLSNWLLNLDPRKVGFDGAAVNQDEVVNYWNLTVGNILQPPLPPMPKSGDVAFNETILQELLSTEAVVIGSAQVLPQGHPPVPVIVQVETKTPDEHHVVVEGETTTSSGTDYYINDPYYSDPYPSWKNEPGHAAVAPKRAYVLLKQSYSTSGLGQMQWLYPPSGVGNPASIEMRMHSPADFIVTDSFGRRTGVDPSTGTTYNEIPGAEYYTEANVNLEMPPAQPDPDKVFVDLTPQDGPYTVQVFGTGVGTYRLDTVAYDAAGNASESEVTGQAQMASSALYTMQYSTTPGTPVSLSPLIDTISPTTTAEGTAGSSAYNFGTWTNQPVQVTLSATDNVGGSGVAHTYYALDNPACTPSATSNCTTYAGRPFTVSAQGSHTLTYFSVDNAGNAEAAHTAAIDIDTSPSSCALTGTGINGSGQKYIQITVQDGGSGLGSVAVTESNNAITPVPAFTSGTTGPVVVTATKINQSQGAQVALKVTDVAGNVTTCDPVLTDVIRDSHTPTITVATGIAQGEHLLHIYNGDPGLTHLTIDVDGKKVHERDLVANQQYTVDIAAWLQPGSNNTVIIIARGKQRGDATIVIADS